MKKLALVGSQQGKKPVQSAQVAFFDQDTWAIIAPFHSLSAQRSHFPMPRVKCPIVDTTNIKAKGLALRITREHTGPQGVTDLDTLLTRLELLGGEVHHG